MIQQHQLAHGVKLCLSRAGAGHTKLKFSLVKKGSCVNMEHCQFYLAIYLSCSFGISSQTEQPIAEYFLSLRSYFDHFIHFSMGFLQHVPSLKVNILLDQPPKILYIDDKGYSILAATSLLMVFVLSIGLNLLQQFVKGMHRMLQ